MQVEKSDRARLAREAQLDDAARAEVLRADGARTLGENLEQADALIRAAYELARGLERARS
jgi:hypothetical protein